MSPLADMLIDQHESLDDALHHARLMQKAPGGDTAASWQFAATEIRAKLNTRTYSEMTAPELRFIALKITQTEDAPLSPCWDTSGGWTAR